MYTVIGDVRIAYILCHPPACNNCNVKGTPDCLNEQGLVKTLEDLIYRIPEGEIRVSAGFITDGSSIPFWAWSIIGHPFSHWYIRSSIFHDALYATKIFPREKADFLFFKFMTNFSFFDTIKAKIIYKALRIFGWYAWNTISDTKHKQALKKVSFI